MAAVWTGLEEQKDPWLGQRKSTGEGEQGQLTEGCMGGVQGVAKFIKSARAVSG